MPPMPPITPEERRRRRRADRHRDDDTDEVQEGDTSMMMRAAAEEEEELEEEEEDEEGLEDELVAADGEEEEFDDDALASPHQPNTPLLNLDPPPSYLREISTLASWTVSSSKPGCSIPQLRHPSTSLFWQSDGPQPHYLNIHFFKLVRIVGLRLYLDFEQDESYTPTRIIFLAGSGMNDLQEWGEMKLESPRGWVWADFSGVGDAESDSDDDENDDEDGEDGLQHSTSGPNQQQRRGANGTTATNNNEDMSSDSENAAPRPPLPRFATAATATTPGGGGPADDAMQLDPQTNATTTPLTYLVGTPQDLHTHTHQTAITPTLTRPTPRLPFAALSPNNTHNNPSSLSRRNRGPPRMPVLRAHLVQIKILENHQNGKDTHLRGLQIFARNDEELSRSVEPRGNAAGKGMKTLMGEDVVFKSSLVVGGGRGVRRPERWDLGMGSRSTWDVEPSIR